VHVKRKARDQRKEEARGIAKLLAAKATGKGEKTPFGRRSKCKNRFQNSTNSAEEGGNQCCHWELAVDKVTLKEEERGGTDKGMERMMRCPYHKW